MRKSTSPYPSVSASATGTGVVSHAGAALLLRTAEKTGLTAAMAAELARFRKPLARHDPGKILLDLAVSLAIGGDCLADIAQLRAHPELFGQVASDPTVSRLISALAGDADTALAAIGRARATARRHCWAAAGTSAPDHAIDEQRPLVIDIDATLVTAHSDKESAAPTFKRGFGFHPLCAFVDHGDGGTGEPVAMLLRPGNAGSNTASDHVTIVQDALAQLPFDPGYRVGKKALVRIDGAGGTHHLIEYLTKRRLSYSVGFSLTDAHAEAIDLVPEQAWTPAYDADGQVRDGAWVTEITDLLDLSSWPKGMRVIVRKERPHPGAQLRFTDRDGLRLTAFVTNTRRGQLPDLELRHRRRARCEDRIRAAKVTGLQNLPLHGSDQNRIWLALVQLACELLAWMQMLALTHTQARRWEPKRLRLRLLSIAGKIARHARHVRLRLATTAPDIDVLVAALNRLAALPAPV
ncbi:IS1380 family transposase [Rhodococcus pyridinivorans]|uniref:IS1380 family transposase n=1 Tax=Rhodococcus pyridinivorans TaxID=103816 RepID=UPI00110D3B2A|nr:IS1380 family transposase [Rhodococcus pyridinivorans]